MVEFPKPVKYPVLPQKGGKMAVRLPPREKDKEQKAPPEGRKGSYQAQPANNPPPTPPPAVGSIGFLPSALAVLSKVILVIVIISFIGVAISVWVETGTAGRVVGYIEKFITGIFNGGGAGTGSCSSDSDCQGFAQRNGGGPVICSSRDHLCHFCYSLRGETCISGSNNCGGDPNLYIERGVCVFKIGGKTTD